MPSRPIATLRRTGRRHVRSHAAADAAGGRDQNL
ncbi:hypothetical protein M218_20295 [Burkholderia pseudomallei MSHR338]|nr:hypothetical protein M218_20295 [Burkholderia pseudomallei MSHR338]